MDWLTAWDLGHIDLRIGTFVVLNCCYLLVKRLKHEKARNMEAVFDQDLTKGIRFLRVEHGLIGIGDIANKTHNLHSFINTWVCSLAYSVPSFQFRSWLHLHICR